MPITVAVDANGADLGPAEVAAGAADRRRSRACASCSSGPPSEIGEVADGVEVVDAPVSIAKAPDPVARRAREPRRLDRARRARRRRGRRRRASSAAARPAPRWPRRSSTSSARAGIHRPALAIPVPVPGHAGHDARRRRQHRGARRAPRPVRASWAPRWPQVVLGVERPRVGLLSNGEEASKGTPLVVEAHAALRDRLAEGGTLRLRRQRRGQRGRRRGKADVVVTDGFTGNVALKLMEGVSEAMLRADPRRRRRRRARAKAGGLLLRPALLEFREVIDPESAGGAYLLGLRRLGVVPHGRFSAPRHRAGDPAGRARRRAATSSGARTPRWRPRTRCAPAAGCPDRPLRLPRHDPRRGLQPHPVAPRRRARGRSRAHRRGDALQGGPGGRLAGPLHARPGARGLLRREDVRRAGGEDPLRGPGRRLRRRPRAHHAPEPWTASAHCSARAARGPAPAGLHPCLVDRAALGLLLAPGLPGRLACSAWRSPRTSTRASRPSATAPGG